MASDALDGDPMWCSKRMFQVARLSRFRPIRVLPVVALTVALALVISGIAPRDRLTWVLETCWIMIGVPVVLLTWRRFPLTTLPAACWPCMPWC
ncbi:MAG: hypothetical protein ACRDQZ_05080 [Mycobacteriales bacterium]